MAMMAAEAMKVTVILGGIMALSKNLKTTMQSQSTRGHIAISVQKMLCDVMRMQATTMQDSEVSRRAIASR